MARSGKRYCTRPGAKLARNARESHNMVPRLRFGLVCVVSIQVHPTKACRNRRLQRKTVQQKEYRCLSSVRLFPVVQIAGLTRVVQGFEAAGWNREEAPVLAPRRTFHRLKYASAG